VRRRPPAGTGTSMTGATTGTCVTVVIISLNPSNRSFESANSRFMALPVAGIPPGQNESSTTLAAPRCPLRRTPSDARAWLPVTVTTRVVFFELQVKPSGGSESFRVPSRPTQPEGIPGRATATGSDGTAS
jgi:hypothetical protein